jgi:hypothetical protein
MVKVLNQQGKNYFKEYSRNGVSVNFDVQFVLDQDMTKEKLPAGDNLINFLPGKGRSYVEHEQYEGFQCPITGGYYKDGRTTFMGKEAQVFLAKAEPQALVTTHETFHLLGLSDRYADGFGPFEYFENDIMARSQKGTTLGDTHIAAFIAQALILFPDVNNPLPQRAVNKKMVDRDMNNKLKQPTPEQIKQNKEAHEKRMERNLPPR